LDIPGAAAAAAAPDVNGITIWPSLAFKQHCKRSARMLQYYKAVMESRGHYFHMGGLITHNTLTGTVNPADKRGAMLPPMLGIPDAVTDEKELRRLVEELPIVNASKPQSLPFAVQYATPAHMRLRSRCILNRARGLAAVAHYRNKKDTSAAIRQCPHCIISNVSIPQTLFHAVSVCPKFQAERSALQLKLRATIDSVRARTATHAYFSQILANNDSIFLHIVMATPYIIESVSNVKSRLALLKLTGQFLEHIHSINPL
jgi:hypothetical protein